MKSGAADRDQQDPDADHLAPGSGRRSHCVGAMDKNPGETWQQIVLRMSGALVPMVPEGLVLLTSLAFAVRRDSAGPAQRPGTGVARHRGLGAGGRGLRRQDGNAHRERTAVQRGRAAGGATLDHTHAVLAQLAGADPRPNASMLALVHALGPVDEPWKVTAMAPFTSAKKWSGLSFDGHGNWVIGAADVLAAPASEAAERAEEIGLTGRRVLLLGSSSTVVDGPQAPGVVEPRALVVLEQKVRPEAAGTLAYFAEQNVAVKVISGDNAKSVGAVTGSLGVETGEVIDAAQPAHRRGGLRRSDRGCRRLRAGHPAAETAHGGGPAVARPQRRHDRRRRQRRAGDQGTPISASRWARVRQRPDQ